MARKKIVLLTVALVVVILLGLFGGILALNYIYPAEQYARQNGLSDNAELSSLDKTWNNDDGIKEKTIIDYALGLNGSYRENFMSDFLWAKDTVAEYRQVLFLESLPRAEQLAAISGGQASNFNWDGDLYSNYFEKFVSHTPVDVKNDVYVIMFTEAGPEYRPNADMHDFLINDAKIPENHVIWRYGQDNNSENLTQTINTVSHEAGKNDSVLAILQGEGVKDYFCFWAGDHYVPYQSINDELNKINARVMQIVIESCYSGSAIPHLESGSTHRTIFTSSSANEKCTAGPAHDFLMAFKNKSADYDGNGYVSVSEAMTFSQNKTINDNLGGLNPQISDPNNIGSSTYLFDIYVGNQ